jgi:hypothetical protein
MELLERYLQAVKFWLPKEQKQDILAELSEDLRSQIEDRETELGRKLNEAEIEAVLRERGRPLLVANRYQPQQHLIGPVLFPVYRFVLRIVALCYLLPWVLVWIGMIFSATYRAQHVNWIQALASTWGTLWVTAIMAVGAVTIVFALLERAQTKSRFLENWNPRKLPPVRDPNQIKRSASIGELVGNFALIVWISYLSSRSILIGTDIRITLSPAWTYFFCGFLSLAIFNLALSGVNLMRPYWTGLRATLRLVTDGLGCALFCWFLKANIVAEIAIHGVSPETAQRIRDGANLAMARSFAMAVIFCVVMVAIDVHRIIRVRSKPTPLGSTVIAAVV